MVATVSDLKARYAIFAAVPDATVQLFLDDALPYVASWDDEADKGQMLLAAHEMIAAKVPGVVQDAAALIPAGVTRFKSGGMDIAMSETAANRSITGRYASTIFGEQFAVLQRRNVGMPRLVGYVEPVWPCW